MLYKPKVNGLAQYQQPGSDVYPEGSPPILDQPTYETDSGQSGFWDAMMAAINAGSRITTSLIQADAMKYRTPYGSYGYGTGPYSGLTPQYAQQYLTAAGGGALTLTSSTSLLLIAGVALVAVMMMARK